MKLDDDGTFTYEGVPDDVLVLRATGRLDKDGLRRIGQPDGRDLTVEKTVRPGDGIERRLEPPKTE